MEKVQRVARDPWTNGASALLRGVHHAGALVALVAPMETPLGAIAQVAAAAAPHFRAPVLGCKAADAGICLKKTSRASVSRDLALQTSLLFFGGYALRTSLYLSEWLIDRPLGSANLARLLPYFRSTQLIALIYDESSQGQLDHTLIAVNSLDLVVALGGMDWTPIPCKQWVRHGLGLGIAGWCAHRNLSPAIAKKV